MTTGNRTREIECEGRFHELGHNIIKAIGTVLELHAKHANVVPSSDVSQVVLKEVFDLIQADVPISDIKDPYFKKIDSLRFAQTFEGSNSAVLVPFIPRYYAIEQTSYDAYTQSQGIDGPVKNMMSSWHEGLNLTANYRLENKKIAFAVDVKKNKDGSAKLSCEKVGLEGYLLKTKFGIGRNEGDKVVSDTPYGIEMFDPDGNLALYVGFWCKKSENGNTMVVAQIQNPSGAKLPGGENTKMGIVGLELARIVAEQIGFSRIETYSADAHPMFRQYPERCGTMKGTFKCIYDKSAKVLGWEGTPKTSYHLNLR